MLKEVYFTTVGFIEAVRQIGEEVEVEVGFEVISVCTYFLSN